MTSVPSFRCIILAAFLWVMRHLPTSVAMHPSLAASGMWVSAHVTMYWFCSCSYEKCECCPASHCNVRIVCKAWKFGNDAMGCNSISSIRGWHVVLLPLKEQHAGCTVFGCACSTCHAHLLSRKQTEVPADNSSAPLCYQLPGPFPTPEAAVDGSDCQVKAGAACPVIKGILTSSSLA